MFVRFFFGLITLGVVAAFTIIFYFYRSIQVDFDSIIEYKPALTTRIYDINGDLIANVFDEENRLYVKYDDIPGRIIEALVAIEDTSFFEHGGVNYEAIFRALIKDIKAMKLVEGASTITQQLVKNMLLSSEKKIERKIKEILISIKIEDYLSKEQILERYLNEIYLGHGYFGIKTAAKGYFRKSLDELTLKEMAILVGLPKAPSSYDPTRYLELSLARANSVVQRMYNLGWITKSEYISATKEVPKVYDDTLTQNRAPYVVDEVMKEARRYLKEIDKSGYEIYTSVDLKVQEIAREALVFGYNEILKRDSEANASVVNGAIVVINPLNGDILAIVGGVDYAKSNFNRATQSKRQPGSSFKPFIYEYAIDSGLSPTSEVADIAKTFDEGAQNEWNPQNYGRRYDGYITMKEALRRSRNLATVNLMNQLGVNNVVKRLQDMGFKDIPSDLSVALGSFGISPLEYSKFYSVFAGGGVMTTPKFIKQAISKDDTVYLFESESKTITTPEQNYLMIDMMRDVVNNGTGRRAKVPEIEVAGKTGTSNNSVDAWFCGYTPELLVIVWYGNDNYKPMRNVEGGARTAAPVFAKFLNSYLALFPGTKRTFSLPNGVYVKEYDDGKKEFYTDRSPLPVKTIYDYQQDDSNEQPSYNDKILF
ncbi:transglycosylase domain-containing protein [uncultured Campylobacter sp.]|uniref:transglycosylase domain-containing protein n=1 Tax=uncultured Campylobacter sp. TaxID=218934 RepID=UPI002622C396|nr:PBP1A family penicillin-binding protein [uncultured Campylobacter sp.]